MTRLKDRCSRHVDFIFRLIRAWFTFDGWRYGLGEIQEAGSLTNSLLS